MGVISGTNCPAVLCLHVLIMNVAIRSTEMTASLIQRIIDIICPIVTPCVHNAPCQSPYLVVALQMFAKDPVPQLVRCQTIRLTLTAAAWAHTSTVIVVPILRTVCQTNCLPHLPFLKLALSLVLETVLLIIVTTYLAIIILIIIYYICMIVSLSPPCIPPCCAPQPPLG